MSAPVKVAGASRPSSLNLGRDAQATLANARPPKTSSEVTAEALSIALRSRFNPLRGITPQLLSQQLDNFMFGFVAFAALCPGTIAR